MWYCARYTCFHTLNLFVIFLTRNSFLILLGITLLFLIGLCKLIRWSYFVWNFGWESAQRDFCSEKYLNSPTGMQPRTQVSDRNAMLTRDLLPSNDMCTVPKVSTYMQCDIVHDVLIIYRPGARGIRRNISWSDDIHIITEGNIITVGNISPNTPSEGSINDILYRKSLLVPKNSFNSFVRFINRTKHFGTSRHFCYFYFVDFSCAVVFF